jgi:hypothetical protein
MSSAVREILHDLGVASGREQEAEFFFYAPTRPAASKLAGVLKEMGYDVSLHRSRGAGHRFLVTGMTNKIRMDDQALALWTHKMCGLAEQYGCVFDGWGTIVHME